VCSMEQLERKLASLSAINSALHAENENLRQRVEEMEYEKDSDDEQMVCELQAEFARRIGQADKQMAELRVSFTSIFSMLHCKGWHLKCLL
jgi:regulator of replication initiation timing